MRYLRPEKGVIKHEIDYSSCTDNPIDWYIGTAYLNISRVFSRRNVLNFRSIIKPSLLISTIVQFGKTPGRVDSGTNFEWSSLQTMRIQLKCEQNKWTQLLLDKNTWTRLLFRSKYVDSIKFSVFLPPQSNFCISTTTFFLPSQIWILFGILTETLVKKALISDNDPRWLSTLPHRRLPSLL